MTPTWAVILIGLASGLVGTLLTISHERAAEMRARMLDAADEFSTGATAALHQARIAAGEIKKDELSLDDSTGWFRREIAQLLDAANGAVDDVLAKQARIDLLFGDQSPAGIAAREVTQRLRGVGASLERRPNSIRDREAQSQYSEDFDRARDEQARFTRAARVAINQTWFGRLLGRWRIWWGSKTHA